MTDLPDESFDHDAYEAELSELRSLAEHDAQHEGDVVPFKDHCPLCGGRLLMWPGARQARCGCGAQIAIGDKL